MTRFRVRDGLTIRALPDGDAVVASESGDDAVIVNATAHAILDLLATSRSESEIVELFCSTFRDQEASAIQRDVSTVLGQLVQSGIVEPCGAESSTA